MHTFNHSCFFKIITSFLSKNYSIAAESKQSKSKSNGIWNFWQFYTQVYTKLLCENKLGKKPVSKIEFFFFSIEMQETMKKNAVLAKINHKWNTV